MAEQEPEVQVEQEAEGDDEDTSNPNYKPPAPKSLDDIVNQDKEDESLNKYKQTLLGNDGKSIIHGMLSVVVHVVSCRKNKNAMFCYVWGEKNR